MAIFHLHQLNTRKEETALPPPPSQAVPIPLAPEERKRDSIFSSVATRFFFFLLLVADLIWGIYGVLLLTIGVIGSLITCFRAKVFKTLISKAFLMLRRCLVCALSLVVGFFSPTFGIMVACTYFLMYDKSGIEEVIPTSLQDQFKDVFKQP